ncbi:MAG TPA: amidohydrolase family protein [Polyangiaceae bacterium]|nr:amidohydrolase family protein [Polyangiaceae bacterium]
MKRYPWVRYLKRSAPELPYDSPIYLGSWSNGEFFHEQSAHERKLHAEILRQGDDRARKLGMDRREFMASAMGFVTALAVIQQGCSSKDSGGGPASAPPSIQPPVTGGPPVTSSPIAGSPAGTPAGGPAPGAAAGGGLAPPVGQSGSGGAMPPMSTMPPPNPMANGQYCFAEDSDVDPTMCEQAARQLLQAPTFIFDGQTHCFDDAPDAAWRKSPPPGFNDSLRSLLFGKCTDDPVSCIGPDDYVRLMFLESSTTMTVLSAWPYGQGPSDPNSNPFLASTRDWINGDLAGSHRVVNHASVVPWIGTNGMDMAASSYGVGGWKLYPAAPGNNYKMNDPTGTKFIEKAITLGVKTFAIHKGLPIAGFSVEHNMPDDIGPVAKMYPEVNFVIYHSAICAGQMGAGFTCTPMEAPYTMGGMQGSDALITSMLANGIQPNTNVFAELGGAFSQMMSNPSACGQWLAKLVQYVGENNVVWGTDSILSGNSPQGQINAFMALQHPMLTPEVKKKILGENMARIYCVDINAKRCQVDQSKLALYKHEMDGEFGDYRWVLLGHQRPLGPTTRREFMRLADWENTMRRRATLG